MNADDRRIDQLLRAALPDDAPVDVRERLGSQLAEFRARADAAGSAPPRRAWIRSGAWGLGVAAAAAVAIATTMVLFVRTPSSFAEAAAAMAKQPWVHARTARASGRTVEAWYSLPKGIAASRTEGVIEYRDHRTDSFYRYDRKSKVLYRLQDYRRRGENQIESLTTAMTLLAQQETTLEKPLADLKFLGHQREEMNVLDQSVEEVTEDGKRWLDYRLTVSYPHLPEPMQMLFRAEAATKLPRLFRMQGIHNGQPVTNETYFDYPDHGPADVYALGVPKDATLVDRVPKGDLKRILATLQAGRERMDPYRATFVSRTEPSDNAWSSETPNLWYRKGNLFRGDYAAGSQGKLPTDPPAADEDLAVWWRQRVKLFRWYPHYVMRGSTQYFVQRGRNEDGSNNDEIVSVKQIESLTKPGLMVPVTYSMRPEFACRPPMGIGDSRLEAVLDMNPDQGPAGCILLTVRRTDDQDINEKGEGLAAENRYWLDPARDYIAMRWDSMTKDDQGQLIIYESDVTEEVARSPGGVWYATKIRRKFPDRTVDGKQLHDQVYYLYVDFDVELPDSFFDPPQPGKID